MGSGEAILPYEFKLPDIGEGVSEGEVIQWHIREGEHVREDQPMVDVMTDKATVTIDVPRAGVVGKLCATVGETVRVGNVLVIFVAEDAQVDQDTAQPDKLQPDKLQLNNGAVASAVGDIREQLPGVSALLHRSSRPASGHSKQDRSTAESYFSEKPLAAPAVRKLARDLDIDLRRVPPTGAEGRVTKEDVMRFKQGSGQSRSHDSHGSSQNHATSGLHAVARQSAAPVPMMFEERRPMVGLRRKIAERMQLAKNTAAHATIVEECNVGELRLLRERLQPTAQQHDVKLTFLPFIIKAVAFALKKHPDLNSRVDEDSQQWIISRRYHLGMAVSTERGLLVPVITHADQKTILEIAKSVAELADGARSGSLSSAQLSGSTFTITSLGAQGGLFATPILNYPEVGILGVHRMREVPIVRNGTIQIGHTMMFSLSFDHRVIDGHVAAAFLYEVIAYLDDPARLMLEMA